MKGCRSLWIALILTLGSLGGCRSSSPLVQSVESTSAPDTAATTLPGTALGVDVVRAPIHRFLAEFSRTIVLLRPGLRPIEVGMLDDTGGYSRVNLYLLSDGTFRLRDAQESFLIPTVNALILFEDPRAAPSGVFQGSFDIDSDHVWRFIPAAERPELPTELKSAS